ncbi:hypothetical protein PYV50_16930 [Pseudomonas sp. H22_DOA]|nr:hypothetical protein PYV50_16930 [Pseudomonas sp. H22_DOA]
MDEPVIQANESLVVNGDFNRLTGWKIGGLVGITADFHGLDRVNLLEATNGGGFGRPSKSPWSQASMRDMR